MAEPPSSRISNPPIPPVPVLEDAEPTEQQLEYPIPPQEALLGERSVRQLQEPKHYALTQFFIDIFARIRSWFACWGKPKPVRAQHIIQRNQPRINRVANEGNGILAINNASPAQTPKLHSNYRNIDVTLVPHAQDENQTTSTTINQQDAYLYRFGTIDSEKSAQEFLDVVRTSENPRPLPSHLRVVSNDLYTDPNQSLAQHSLMLDLAKLHGEEVDIAHLSTAAAPQEQNVTGLATYLHWLGQDLNDSGVRSKMEDLASLMDVSNSEMKPFIDNEQQLKQKQRSLQEEHKKLFEQIMAQKEQDKREVYKIDAGTEEGRRLRRGLSDMLASNFNKMNTEFNEVGIKITAILLQRYANIKSLVRVFDRNPSVISKEIRQQFQAKLDFVQSSIESEMQELNLNKEALSRPYRPLFQTLQNLWGQDQKGKYVHPVMGLSMQIRASYAALKDHQRGINLIKGFINEWKSHSEHDTKQLSEEELSKMEFKLSDSFDKPSQEREELEKSVLRQRLLRQEDPQKYLQKLHEKSKSMEVDLQLLHGELHEVLIPQFHDLKSAEQQLEYIGPLFFAGRDKEELQKMKMELVLTRMLIGSQLGLEPLSKDHEQLVGLVLNHIMGAVDATNSDDGVNLSMRHAAGVAVKQMLVSNVPMKDLYDMVINWADTTTTMNKPNGQYSTRAINVTKFRNFMFNNLMGFGLPASDVTKWDMQDPAWYNFLPKHYYIGERPVQLVKYDKHGNPVRLTERARTDIFMGAM